MKGIGTDIIEINRIKEIKDKPAFVKKILSVKERVVYESFKHEQRKAEYLAGRWALKEAIYKAATNFCQDKSYGDFSILNDDLGKPYLSEPFIDNIHLSVSHCKNYAVAFVVID